MFPPQNCSGCGMCAQLCPFDAIKMEKNTEGFLYPQINFDKCTHCEKCKKKCPVLNPPMSVESDPQSFACKISNEFIREQSSSGGVFSMLAEYVISLHGIVVGCAMTEDCYEAKHRVVSNTEDLYLLRGSKYLQSQAYHTFSTVKEALQDHRWVLFSGTACQVLGLRAYLEGVSLERLITVGVVCHGVPSPAVWKKYVQHLENEKESKVVSVQFRNKEKGWRQYSLVLDFENGEHYSKIGSKDLFCRGFVADLFLRRSCYACVSKKHQEVIDVILGDMWGAHNICPSIDDNKGVSWVLLNTPKGRAVFEALSSDIVHTTISFEEAIKHNPSYQTSSSRILFRNVFMKKFHRTEIIPLLEKCLSNSLSSRIKRKLLHYMHLIFSPDK